MTILPPYDGTGTADQHCIRCGHLLGSQRIWLNNKGPYCPKCVREIEREAARREEDDIDL